MSKHPFVKTTRFPSERIRAVRRVCAFSAYERLFSIWHVLHVQGALGVVPVFLVYPVIPWVGVMALGYAAGPWIFSQDPAVSRRLAWAGVALWLSAFAIIACRAGVHDGGSTTSTGSGGNTTLAASSLVFSGVPERFPRKRHCSLLGFSSSAVCRI